MTGFELRISGVGSKRHCPLRERGRERVSLFRWANRTRVKVQVRVKERERDNISDQVQNPACSFLHIFDFSFFAKLKHRKTFSLCRLFRFKDTAFSLLFTTWILATLNLGYVRVLTYSYTYSSTYSSTYGLNL